MPVSQSLPLLSIDPIGPPAEAVAWVVEFCRRQAGSALSVEAFETVGTGL